jgi:hypothetical protein
MHLITATKNNISAVEVQRQLGIKNYMLVGNFATKSLKRKYFT